MMKKGFLAFALGTVFLLALVSSGASFSDFREDTSYQRYQYLHLQDVAIKQAFYSAISDAARARAAWLAAEAAAGGGIQDPREEIRQAAFARAMEFESQLAAQGYGASFWCGAATEKSRQAASLEMEKSHAPVSPGSTSPLQLCFDSFDVDVASAKIHLRDLGFSHYSEGLAIGTASVFPSSYEPGFGGGLA